jgi:putative peptidoglycan lipid II flippase
MSISFKKQTIGQASILIATFTILSQALGLIRESLVANYLGTSADYDILLVALAIPAMIGTILMMSLPAAGIPSLQSNSSGQGVGSNIFRSRFFMINLIMGLILAAIAFFCLPILGGLLATGLDEARVQLAIKYGGYFCLLIPLRSLEAVFQSFLHVRYHFVLPAISTIGFNLVIIGLLVGLFPSLGSQAYIIATIAGILLEMVMVAVPTYFIYRRSGPLIDNSGFQMSGYIRFLGIIVLIDGLGLLVDPFDRYLAGIFLPPGYISANYYANLVGHIPIRIFVMSLGMAIFPSLSEVAAKKNMFELARLYHKAVAICIMLVIPVAVYSIIFKNEIISFLFERGQFNELSRAMTVAILPYYLAGMIFSSLYFIQSRVLYSLKSWTNLLWARIVSLAAKVAIGVLLIKTNWALAIGGGTLAMFVVLYLIIEHYLIKKNALYYLKSDLKLVTKSGLIAVGVVLSILLAEILSTKLLGLRPILAAVATAGIGTLCLMISDGIFDVSGFNLKKYIKKRKLNF